MRWLVGWSRGAAGTGAQTGPDGPGRPDAHDGPGSPGPLVEPVGARLLWGEPAPLWAVGDWRPDEVRVVHADDGTRLAVLGRCGASDDALRSGLLAARGGALRHLTAWPGSYTAVARVGRRLTVAGDLAGARPVFHAAWSGGTAYATAALPLADLVESELDIGYLAALLACPDSPEALADGTPYTGVRRVPPGHALVLRDGARDITGYEPTSSLAVAAPQLDARQAIEGVREAMVEAVRARLAAPRHALEYGERGGYGERGDGHLPGGGAHGSSDSYGSHGSHGSHGSSEGVYEQGRAPGQGSAPGAGPAHRRTAYRRGPAPGVGADLSGGSASGTLALLAAGLPGLPGTPLGFGAGTGERLLAVTFNDLASDGGRTRESELERARAIAANPRLRHVIVAAGTEALPYAELYDGPLTDEPGPAIASAARHRRRLAAGGADHLVGHGARQVLDAHPARLADLLMDRRRRHLLKPVSALARADGPSAHSLFVPFTVYRAARRLARTPYREGLEAAAAELLAPRPYATVRGAPAAGGPVAASLAALTWCRPGPAARWLTGEALAEVSVRLQSAAVRANGLAQRPGERRAAAALSRHAADHRVLEQAAEVRGQRLHAPFLDNQVVRACRALPEALRVQPGARASVLRSVLAGAGIRELPPGWGAPSHAAHAAAGRAGIGASLGPLQDLFATPLLADAGLVDAGVVRGALHAAASGVPLPLDGLAELVSAEVWLRRLLARRGTCWTGPAAPRRRAVASGVPPRPGL
ncbi:asparagine synthase-related protein [Streptomyces sp. UNOB3_S3]|uniref:asparagine synthase-related protein n=1 Tax=Streptomyces sp. UNOB3_S3 TaxID=2871682 RepID=UPI001E2F9A8F|nr:asparagine synthase-related protein [Streptomyces sp. UNOB3_S3]MCC3778099.1 asparagine synthase [Streptomyces sp. UNOB3_S3]